MRQRLAKPVLWLSEPLPKVEVLLRFPSEAGEGKTGGLETLRHRYKSVSESL